MTAKQADKKRFSDLKPLLVLGVALALFIPSVGCKNSGVELRKVLRSAARDVNKSDKPRSDKRSKGKQGKADQKSSNPDEIKICPEGSRRYGKPPPRGLYQYCAAANKDGKTLPHGPYRKWHKNGKLKLDANYKLGKYHGRYAEFFPSGANKSEGMFNEGLQHGTFTEWNKKGGKRLIETYVNGERNGPAAYWSRKGKLERKGMYRNDVSDGIWSIYHSNGKLKSKTAYSQGLKNGRSEEYHREGSLIAKAGYSNDIEHGPWISYWLNGNPKEQGVFSEGTKTGKWVEYRKDGTPKNTVWYRDGVIVKSDSAGRKQRNASKRKTRSRRARFGSGDIFGGVPPSAINRRRKARASAATTERERPRPIEPDRGWTSM
jgi:antitoxin component YwqK of YwqJK toxin-antitoxin module